MMVRLFAVASLLLFIPAARALGACPLGSSFQCQGRPVDISASNTNLTAPAGCDTCPGHCSLDPAFTCTSDSECPSGLAPCRFDTGVTFSHCVNPGTAGRACVSDSNCFVSEAEPGDCDPANDPRPFGGDGTCTVRYTNGGSTARTVTGTSSNDAICASALSSGVVTVNAGDGDDGIEGFGSSMTLNGGSGNDVVTGTISADAITGGPGNNILKGGGGDDSIQGGPDDDIIFGGDGNDSLFGQGGRDVMKGETGNDLLITNVGGPVTNDVLGSLLCGGTGNDLLVADGPGHQCMDGGPDQALQPGFADDCTYFNAPDDTDSHDVGTARNCAHASQATSGGTLLARTSGCGCD